MKKLNISPKAQNAIMLGCMCSIAYFAVYIARNTLGAVSPQMIEDGSFTTENIGTLSSVYFITYAFGQLINGAVGDKIKANATGLLTSVAQHVTKGSPGIGLLVGVLKKSYIVALKLCDLIAEGNAFYLFKRQSHFSSATLTKRIEVITTSLRGLSLESVLTFAMASTTSMP